MYIICQFIESEFLGGWLIDYKQKVFLDDYEQWNEPISPSCYIVSQINIDNWPCLRINNFQQMNQTRSLAETSTLHDLRALQVLIDQLEKYVSET